MSNHSSLSHILELRDRVTKCLISYAIIVTPLIIFGSKVFEFFTKHVFHMPGAQIIATEVTAPFMVPLKLALYLGLYIAAPIIFYQIWRFLAPGLYPNEKKPIFILSVISLSLFYLGACFAYFLVCPVALKFFMVMAPSNVQVMTDMGLYLSFILKMLLCFGLAFQVPIIVSILILTQIQTATDLKQKRPYVIVGAFVIGMLLTPPDVVSQILMAIPMIALFELGLVLGKVFLPKSNLPAKQLT